MISIAKITVILSISNKKKHCHWYGGKNLTHYKNSFKTIVYKINMGHAKEKKKKMTSITIIKNKISSQNSVPAEASFRG